MSVSVAIENLSVELSGNKILDEVSLRVEAGAFVTLLGPSGSGKTTTLNVLAGFLPRQTGSIRLGDQLLDDLPAHKRNIGFLFQNYALFPHLTVAENIAFPLIARKTSKADQERMVEAALELVQLPGRGGRAVRSLSGGQQQRIALARALVFGPKLLLLDEPLAALDKQLREAMQLELKRIQAETGTTTIAVTHDQTEALSMADAVAIMNNGRVEQFGTPQEVYRRPVNAFVAGFLGEANLVPVQGERLQAFGTKVEGQGALASGVLRPEDLQVVEPGADVVCGRIVGEVFQGSRRRLVIAAEGITEPLVVSAPANVPLLQRDGVVGLRVTLDLVHAIAAAG